MIRTVQNGPTSIKKLFSLGTFHIPQYQRAYSWESPQLSAFLEDLRQQVETQAKFPEKHYFLGTLLLHEEDLGSRGTIVNIVDGQQRLTTVVILVASALRALREGKDHFSNIRRTLLRRTFVCDDDAEGQKFHTIHEDDAFFQSHILGISAAIAVDETPSAHRLRSARTFFESVSPEEWEPLISALEGAIVMVYAVDSAEDATQIFELQNDRGKPLTDLEALKSYLMHCVYLCSRRQADSVLSALQTEFAGIFRTIETLSELPEAPEEDALLAYHCTAFLPWKEKEYSKPKELVRSIIKKLDDASVVCWIQDFVSNLKLSFTSVLAMLKSRDTLPELSELLLLERMASYWPLLLKCWKEDPKDTTDKSLFRKACRLLEVFTFRGPAIAGLRSDSGASALRTAARDFGSFPDLFDSLHAMSREYDLERRFLSALDSSNFYGRGTDALYLLWRYENHLRDQPGRKQPLLRWQDFIEPRSHAAKFSIEHIAAQDNPIATTLTEWTAGDPESFADVALHRLGNLVIDSVSPNASKGKRDFSEKLKSLSNSTYLSQGELINFLQEQEVVVWDANAIKRRHQHLMVFAYNLWNPDRWHTPTISNQPQDPSGAS